MRIFLTLFLFSPVAYAPTFSCSTALANDLTRIPSVQEFMRLDEAERRGRPLGYGSRLERGELEAALWSLSKGDRSALEFLDFGTFPREFNPTKWVWAVVQNRTWGFFDIVVGSESAPPVVPDTHLLLARTCPPENTSLPTLAVSRLLLLENFSSIRSFLPTAEDLNWILISGDRTTRRLYPFATVISNPDDPLIVPRSIIFDPLVVDYTLLGHFFQMSYIPQAYEPQLVSTWDYEVTLSAAGTVLNRFKVRSRGIFPEYENMLLE